MPQKLSWAFCLAACLVQLSLACWYPTALYCRGSCWTLWWLLRLNSTTKATLSLSNSRIKVHLSHSELSFWLNFISVPLDYLLFNLCARRCDCWCDNGNYLPTLGLHWYCQSKLTSVQLSAIVRLCSAACACHSTTVACCSHSLSLALLVFYLVSWQH